MNNPPGKTIKQIADELGVSKQAVHQKRKAPALSTTLRPLTSTVGGVVYIAVDGEKLIKSAFRCDTANYHNLPHTILISIIGFRLFKRKAFHSEFQLLEVFDHTPLTDKQVLHFFELPKLPLPNGSEAEADLWLALFAAKSEEDLKKIEALGGSHYERSYYRLS
jgi:hypothetical protein